MHIQIIGKKNIWSTDHRTEWDELKGGDRIRGLGVVRFISSNTFSAIFNN